MGQIASELIRKLHPADPYVDFPYTDYPADITGGGDDAWLLQLLRRVRPRLVIEVGSWKGATALSMAAVLKELGTDAAVICVDTWLGSIEHWKGSVRGWDIRPYLKHGYPTLYYQFLANVLHQECQDLVVPVPNTSSNAARWFYNQQIVADLVYLDGSHEEDDVYSDLCSYWKLLRPGGVLVGDDWHAYWFGVICAVNKFARERNLPLEIHGQKWLIRKAT